MSLSDEPIKGRPAVVLNKFVAAKFGVRDSVCIKVKDGEVPIQYIANLGSLVPIGGVMGTISTSHKIQITREEVIFANLLWNRWHYERDMCCIALGSTQNAIWREALEKCGKAA